MLRASKLMRARIVMAAVLLLCAAVPAFAAMLGEDVYTGDPIARIAKEASPAVVNIDTETMITRSASPFGGSPFFNDPFFREFFGDLDRYNRSVPMRGKGSGFIIDKEGHILTNDHVVTDSGRVVDSITVTLLDGRELKAEVIGRDPTFDLAVIKVDERDLPTLRLGDSDKAEIGQWVVAIGNPHGFDHTVTAGIISGKDRTLAAGDVNLQGMMQTDAAINPGNSGGPLVDLNGDVIAINTAIVPYAQGIGFAVPINMAKQIMDDLIKNGEVKRGWLGIYVQPMTKSFADAYSVPTEEGAIVADIVEGSPAEKAGFKRGDVIVSIDGEKVKNSQDVVNKVRSKLSGVSAKLEIYRDGRKQTISLKLGDIPGSDQDGSLQGRRGDKRRSDEARTSDERIGATVSEIDQDLKRRYELKQEKGLVVTDVERGSFAARAGLRPGDVILEVDRKKVATIGEWESAVPKEPKAIVMLVSRSGQTHYLSYRAE